MNQITLESQNSPSTPPLTRRNLTTGNDCDRRKFNDQFKNIFGTEQLRTGTTLGKHIVTEDQLRKSMGTFSPKKQSIGIPLFKNPLRSQNKGMKILMQNEMIMGQQKSKHNQQVSQNRAQKLQQLQIERKRQIVEQNDEYLSIEELLMKQQKEEETATIRRNYKYQINDYEGQLLRYPLLVSYLTNQRYMHAAYIENHILGVPQANPLTCRRMATSQRDSPVNTEANFNGSFTKVNRSTFYEDGQQQRNDMLKRIRQVLNRYAQHSTWNQNRQDRQNSPPPIVETLNPRQLKQSIKYQTLEAIVSELRKNRQKVAIVHQRRFENLKRGRATSLQ